MQGYASPRELNPDPAFVIVQARFDFGSVEVLL